jgi:hypothetical protein
MLHPLGIASNNSENCEQQRSADSELHDTSIQREADEAFL